LGITTFETYSKARFQANLTEGDFSSLWIRVAGPSD